MAECFYKSKRKEPENLGCQSHCHVRRRSVFENSGTESDEECGKVWVADETGLHVKTGDGILVIEELQLEGKKRMKTADFLRGYAIEPGTRLGE